MRTKTTMLSFNSVRRCAVLVLWSFSSLLHADWCYRINNDTHSIQPFVNSCQGQYQQVNDAFIAEQFGLTDFTDALITTFDAEVFSFIFGATLFMYSISFAAGMVLSAVKKGRRAVKG